MNDVSEIRRAYKHNKITNAFWIRSQQSNADNHTPNEANNILRNTFHTGKLDFTIAKRFCE